MLTAAVAWLLFKNKDHVPMLIVQYISHAYAYGLLYNTLYRLAHACCWGAAENALDIKGTCLLGRVLAM